MKVPLFPKDFLWGASTASHQVEGGTVNQWTEWELANASRLARQAEKSYGKLPHWTAIRERATDPSNYVSTNGVDHYNRYKEDFDIAKGLNFNAFRFGIEWSRLEPLEGKWDEAAIVHYQSYIKELNSRGIKPVLNIWHWTNPAWFEAKGGFTKKTNLPDFDRFVEKVTQTLLEGVDYVITLNEANSFVAFGYTLGKWPPSRRNPLVAIKVYHNLVLAHRRAYDIIKHKYPEIQIGIAHNTSANYAKQPLDPFNWLTAKAADYIWMLWFYDRIKNHQDFVGMNFYFTNYFRGVWVANPARPLSDMGWYVEPGSLSHVLQLLHKRYAKPILVAENGIADEEDVRRKWWIMKSIQAITKARTDGVNVIGYLHWSLLDNFEWSDGWWPKFGLVAVDRQQGMTRTIRPSAEWYGAEIARHRGLPLPSQLPANKPVPKAAVEPAEAPKIAPAPPLPPVKPPTLAQRYKLRRTRRDN